MGTCIFCGAVGKLTREHIWADWLKAYIPKNATHYTAHRATVWRGGRRTDRGSRRVGGDVKSRRVKCVCSSGTYPPGTKDKGCNDGWMGQLQERVKPTLIALLDGRQCRLDQNQQMTLVGWIAMAIMCSEFGRDDSLTISQEDRTFLYRHQVPPLDNWAIWIGDYDRKTWIPEWAGHVLTITEEETTETAFNVRPPLNTQSTTFTVSRLYIHCISSKFMEVVKDFRFDGTDGIFLHRIWPPRSAVIYWPPRRTLVDSDADRIASTLFRWLVKMAGG